MNRKMLFFVNPKAGQLELRNRLMEVLSVFTAAGYDVTVHTTLGAGDLTSFLIREAEHYDLVVCAGGDGTLNETVSGLMQLHHRPLLGYLPAGTVNDVAATLGLSRDPVEAARTVIGGTPYAIDIGSLGQDRWFTYVAGFGAFTDVSYQTPQQDKRIFGRLAYLLNGVKSLGEIRPIHVRVETDTETIEDDVLLGLVCSTTSVAENPSAFDTVTIPRRSDTPLPSADTTNIPSTTTADSQSAHSAPTAAANSVPDVVTATVRSPPTASNAILFGSSIMP